MFDNFISLLYNLAFCWMWKLSDKPAIPLNKKLHGYAIVYDNFAATCHDDSTVLIPILEEMKKSEGPLDAANSHVKAYLDQLGRFSKLSLPNTETKDQQVN